MVLRIIIFLLINFTGLFLGGLFTQEGVPSDWYQNLNKAPWTPPGWLFGFAWTTIMICFSIFLSVLWKKISIDPFYIPVLYSIDIKCDLESLIFLLQMGFHCLNCHCFFNIYDRFHS